MQVPRPGALSTVDVTVDERGEGLMVAMPVSAGGTSGSKPVPVIGELHSQGVIGSADVELDGTCQAPATVPLSTTRLAETISKRIGTRVRGLLRCP